MAKSPKAAPKAAPAARKTMKAEIPEVEQVETPEDEQEAPEAEDEQEAPQGEVDQSVYDELLAAVREIDENFAEPHAKETAVDFYGRLCRIVSDMPEEAWNALSEKAQTWYDATIEAIEKGTAPPILDGAPSALLNRGKKTGAEALAELNAKRKAAAEAKRAEAEANGETPKKGRKAKAPKEKKERGGSEDALTMKIRVLFLADMNQSVDDIEKKLKAEGVEYKRATVVTSRYDTIRNMKALKLAGYTVTPPQE